MASCLPAACTLPRAPAGQGRQHAHVPPPGQLLRGAGHRGGAGAAGCGPGPGAPVRGGWRGGGDHVWRRRRQPGAGQAPMGLYCLPLAGATYLPPAPLQSLLTALPWLLPCPGRCLCPATPDRARCLSPSTWRPCGTCPASLSAKTTTTVRWEGRGPGGGGNWQRVRTGWLFQCSCCLRCVGAGAGPQ